MIQVYEGDGKGKTTAAFGAALRAVGHGWRVCVAQFLKDGTSGEVRALRRLPGVEIVSCDPGITFSFRMNEAQRADARAQLARVASRAGEALRAGGAEMLVLDEACAAVSSGLLDEAALLGLLDEAVARERAGGRCEVIVTGRGPSRAVLDRADYVTEMRCVRHPYEDGVTARPGVEF
ncbi:MAG: cob(I)yrinic acid a,c-diamide adenosyltransferase [Coriobacteriales bacterium]|jgi:cob(I)alamin adenosyltransferase